MREELNKAAQIIRWPHQCLIDARGRRTACGRSPRRSLCAVCKALGNMGGLARRRRPTPLFDA
eukprot:6005711-Pyramimonas_sp.AAC.1